MQACYFDNFCLGMCDWTDCPGREASTSSSHLATPAIGYAHERDVDKIREPLAPLALQPHRSTPLQSNCTGSKTSSTLKPNSGRFSTFVNDEELAILSKGMVPVNTDRNTKWALSNFFAWKEARNEKYPDNPVPEDLFTCSDPATLNTQLSRFVVETRKANGELYPPKTVHQLLCGLLRYMRDANPECPNFLDKKDSRFKPLQGAMDAHFHHLHSTGIGREIKHARVLTKDDEEKLWRSGIMGTNTPKALQNAVFYMIGKMFSLRGGAEMRQIKISQVKRCKDPDRYVYTELVSKTNSGTFKKIHVTSKVVPMFASAEAGERCPVQILDLYYSKLPPEAFENDVFFVRPLESVPDDPNKPWYSCTPVGKNTLESKLKKMCSLAGIEGRVTNHSLRATSVTQMYESGVPEKVIQERTGHKSLDALRVYERTNAQQHETVSKLLSAPHSCTYNEHTQISRQHSSFSSVSLKQPCTDTQSVSISLSNLQGCTININNTSGTVQNPSLSSLDLTHAELDELFSDFLD